MVLYTVLFYFLAYPGAPYGYPPAPYSHQTDWRQSYPFPAATMYHLPQPSYPQFPQMNQPPPYMPYPLPQRRAEGDVSKDKPHMRTINEVIFLFIQNIRRFS